MALGPRWSRRSTTSMPVLLTEETEFSTWLNNTPTEAMSLARQYPPECMRIVQEGFTKQDMLEAA